jgi:hypothetical protein
MTNFHLIRLTMSYPIRLTTSRHLLTMIPQPIQQFLEAAKSLLQEGGDKELQTQQGKEVARFLKSARARKAEQKKKEGKRWSQVGKYAPDGAREGSSWKLLGMHIPKRPAAAFKRCASVAAETNHRCRQSWP